MLSITLTLSPGLVAEGVMLAVSKDRMRIVLPGSEDTTDLYRFDGQWYTADNTPVELAALMTDGQTDLVELSHIFPQTLSASHG